jgi:hypothetical protein
MPTFFLNIPDQTMTHTKTHTKTIQTIQTPELIAILGRKYGRVAKRPIHLRSRNIDDNTYTLLTSVIDYLPSRSAKQFIILSKDVGTIADHIKPDPTNIFIERIIKEMDMGHSRIDIEMPSIKSTGENYTKYVLSIRSVFEDVFEMVLTIYTGQSDEKVRIIVVRALKRRARFIINRAMERNTSVANQTAGQLNFASVMKELAANMSEQDW